MSRRPNSSRNADRGPVPEPLAALRPLFEQCRLRERQSLWWRWQQLGDAARRGDAIDTSIVELREQLQQSIDAVALRL